MYLISHSNQIYILENGITINNNQKHRENNKEHHFDHMNQQTVE